MSDVSVQEFLSAVSTLDDDIASRVHDAHEKGQVLRYVAQITPDGGTVGLQPVDGTGLLGALQGPANFVAFHTKHYSVIPLSISGPGAGPRVTAAGVLGDIVDLAKRMI
jgi:homoserine dehydrogenase